MSPTSVGVGSIVKRWALSASLSVCTSRVSTYSRTERLCKPKIGVMEAHHTSNP